MKHLSGLLAGLGILLPGSTACSLLVDTSATQCTADAECAELVGPASMCVAGECSTPTGTPPTGTPPTGTPPGPGTGSVRPTLPTTTPPKGPTVVPPTAVKRVSGELPRLTTIARPGTEVPPTVSVKICVDAGGAVDGVQVGGSLRDRDVFSCVRSIAMQMRFPRVEGGSCAVVNVPYSFSPRE